MPNPIQFPADEGVHPRAKTEWWYMNGHLADVEGGRYDFFSALVNMPSVLEVKFNPDHWHPPVNFPDILGATALDGGLTVRSPDNDPLHFALREVKPYVIPWNPMDTHGLAQGHLESSFATWVGPVGSMERTGGQALSLVAPFGKDVLVTLALDQARKPQPLLVGGQGEVHMGPLGLSRYYSFPYMDAVGTVSINGVVTPVRGQAWMDHQWGDMAFFDGYDRWRWFGIQLDDLTEIITFIFWDAAGNVVQTNASILLADGTQQNLQAMTDQGQAPVMSVTDRGQPWVSPVTGCRYPLRPTVSIPAFNAVLELDPVMFNQEMVGKGPRNFLTQGPFFPDYWEGGMTVRGTRNGQAVTGKAFYELLGYSADTAAVRSGPEAVADALKEFREWLTGDGR
ncbi:MAG: hypothetical protein HY904_16725 [Deltaproteobacteria bacterium]|nr:hypothetical protein [Deltaproteobacteria bacterium]